MYSVVLNEARHERVQALKSRDVDAVAAEGIMKQIGEAIAKMHDGGLVHGDLTTSNMLLEEGSKKLVIIDFGLAFNSTNPEDKAVDLHVCERALNSAHSDREGLFKTVLEAYKKASKNHCPVFNRFAEVRLRGRKRTMVG
jgi:TP53 regulating kinase and related kinases